MPFIESDPKIKDILESPENFKKISKMNGFKKTKTVVDSLSNIVNIILDKNNDNNNQLNKKENSDNSESNESDDDDEFY